MKLQVPITDLVEGESARIIQFLGGRGMAGRLERLGIRVGGTVRAVSAPRVLGPVVLSVAGSQVAIGHGMGTKVVVEVDR